MSKVERKIIQVAVCPRFTTVLCDDGTLWWMSDSHATLKGWQPYSPIPQPEDDLTGAPAQAVSA